jgi:hypothetical protein
MFFDEFAKCRLLFVIRVLEISCVAKYQVDANRKQQDGPRMKL